MERITTPLALVVLRITKDSTIPVRDALYLGYLLAFFE